MFKAETLTSGTIVPLLSLDLFHASITFERFGANENMFKTMFGRSGLDITNIIPWLRSRAVHAEREACSPGFESRMSLLPSDGDYRVVEEAGSGFAGRDGLIQSACPDFVVWLRNDLNLGT